jgi:glycosyltransferase involved in cell wall biosynthesis
MLTHSYYEEDPRVRREAETLVRAGRPVEVFALRRPDDPPEGELEGVLLHRLDVQRHQGAGLGRYLVEYLSFIARASVTATAAHRRARFALVQVHTLPDFLVFAALHFRIAGIPLVLDLHEAMPEFFRIRFPRASNALVQRALLAQERASILAADAVITVNDALAGRLISLGVPTSKVTVVLNSPDLARFDPARFDRRAFMADGTLRLVYAGALTPTYEVDVAIEAMAEIKSRRPHLPVTFDVYGRGDASDSWAALADVRGLSSVVRFHGRIPIEDVPAALARADIGLAPTRRTEFTDYSLSTKIFEYGAMAKAVVASRLPLVVRTFAQDSIATYEPGEAHSLATAILRLVDEPLERATHVVRTAARVGDLSWAHESQAYVGLIEGLIRRRGTGGVSHSQTPGAGEGPMGHARRQVESGETVERSFAGEGALETDGGQDHIAAPAYAGRP